MSPQFYYAKLKSFPDLVKLVATFPTQLLKHVVMNEKNVYFVHLMGFQGSMVYYVEMPVRIKEKYVVYNRFRDQVTFSDNFRSDGQSACIPILELELTNIFPEYPPQPQ
jgi:hypothetical protein